jgi:hypothetical protein
MLLTTLLAVVVIFQGTVRSRPPEIAPAYQTSGVYLPPELKAMQEKAGADPQTLGAPAPESEGLETPETALAAEDDRAAMAPLVDLDDEPEDPNDPNESTPLVPE